MSTITKKIVIEITAESGSEMDEALERIANAALEIGEDTCTTITVQDE